MKRPETSNPKAELNDIDEMRDAIEALNAEGVRFSRPTQYQLKVGDLSFYPGTGSIFRDGEDKAWEQRGLGALISHLRKLRKPADSAPANYTNAPPAIALRDISRAEFTISSAGSNLVSGKRVISMQPTKRLPG